MKKNNLMITSGLLAALLLSAAQTSSIRAQDEENDEAATPTTAKAGREQMAKIKILRGTVSAVNAAGNTLTVMAKDGSETVIAVVPTTELIKREQGQRAADLAVGDVLSLPAVSPMAMTVTSIAPLTVKLGVVGTKMGEVGTLTFSKTDGLYFSRLTVMKLADIANGANIVAVATPRDGGTNEASNITVIMLPVKVGRVKK